MRTAYCNLELSQSEIISSKLCTKTIPEGLGPSLALHCSQKETRSKVSENPTSLPKVECAVRARIPTTTGSDLWLHLYKNDIDNKEHLAFVFGDQTKSQSLNQVRNCETELSRMVRGAYTGVLHPGRTSCRAASQLNQKQNLSLKSNSPLVRVHSECYTGETAWSTRCDCGQQLDEAARMMMAAGSGVIIYLRQEGRGIGLGDKLKAYNLQDMGFDTVDANLLLGLPADARTYGIATAILKDLGLGNDSNTHGIRLLTNNPDKLQSIEGLHNEVTVKERVPITPVGWEASEHDPGNGSPELLQYLRTKVDKMGHLQPSGQVANKT